jgi:hypothetical protein
MIYGRHRGIHLIRRDCPHDDRVLPNAGATITRNGKLAGRECTTGMAYLSSGGNLDHLEDYACAPDGGRCAQTEIHLEVAPNWDSVASSFCERAAHAPFCKPNCLHQCSHYVLIACQ